MVVYRTVGLGDDPDARVVAESVGGEDARALAHGAQVRKLVLGAEIPRVEVHVPGDEVDGVLTGRREGTESARCRDQTAEQEVAQRSYWRSHEIAGGDVERSAYDPAVLGACRTAGVPDKLFHGLRQRRRRRSTWIRCQ